MQQSGQFCSKHADDLALKRITVTVSKYQTNMPNRESRLEVSE
jgi:hypothetical protein